MIDCDRYVYLCVVALMQHEQIKKEFVKQGGLDILILFIRDGDLNKQSPKQLEDALKILWLSTFNNPQALNTLQKDTKLMSRVNEVLANAKQNTNSSLEKAAEGLIWKVEKEEKFKQQQEEKKRKAEETGIEEEEQYDCMISYSWADMELAHKIFHHLTEKLGYKVWIDQEQMHGSTIEAMVYSHTSVIVVNNVCLSCLFVGKCSRKCSVYSHVYV
jgi:hypothetical protein